MELTNLKICCYYVTSLGIEPGDGSNPLLAISSLLVALLNLCSFISEDWSQKQMSILNKNRVRLGFHFYLKFKPSLLKIIRSLE